MKSPTPNPTAAQIVESARIAWSKALQRDVHADLDVIPIGWLTRQEVQAHWKLRKSQTRDRLSSMLKAGAVETKKLRIWQSNRVMPVPHYKLL